MEMNKELMEYVIINNIDIDIYDLLMLNNLLGHNQNIKTLSDDIYIICRKILKIVFGNNNIDDSEIPKLFKLNDICPICAKDHKRLELRYINGCCVNNHYPPLETLTKRILKHLDKNQKIDLLDYILDNKKELSDPFSTDTERKILKGNFDTEFILLQHEKNKLEKIYEEEI